MSLRHIHMRKRASGKALHSFPAEKRSVRWIDRIVYVVGIVSPAMMIPQLLLIYTTKNAEGFAPLSWLAITAFNIPWIIYSVVHKEKPLLANATLWFIVNGLILIGALLY